MEDHHHKHLFFFFLLFLSVFVQQLLIYPGTVICQTNVRHLPGFRGSLPFDLETGYVRVDEDNDVQLFYYFIKSERNASEDPLIVWLTGGPGCSSVSGLLYELGPLKFKKARYKRKLPSLILNPHSWTKVSNVIFLDAPVGTGFSYSTTSQGLLSSDTKSAIHTHNFISKWLIDHPEFIPNPFYVAGDSYAGIVAPLVMLHISNGIKANNKPVINLKGYILGNPITDRYFDLTSRIPFAHGMGIISNELYESTKQKCGGKYLDVDPENTDCIKELKYVSECTSGLEFFHVLGPKCDSAATKLGDGIVEQRRSLNNIPNNLLFLSSPVLPEMDCRGNFYILSFDWANNDRVQKALNIRKGTIRQWIRCNNTLPYTKDVKSSIEYHQILSRIGYRSLIYSGDHDLQVPFLGTEAWIKSLNYSIIDDWRPWKLNGQIPGYTRKYANNMTFATVKGAGHVAPEYKPEECAAMFKRWISHNPL